MHPPWPTGPLSHTVLPWLVLPLTSLQVSPHKTWRASLHPGAWLLPGLSNITDEKQLPPSAISVKEGKAFAQGLMARGW
jgi:hypothetical protein